PCNFTWPMKDQPPTVAAGPGLAKWTGASPDEGPRRDACRQDGRVQAMNARTDLTGQVNAHPSGFRQELLVTTAKEW
ncbi:MAG TPA: hypothetical protein VMM13_08940, partial [Euzebya sp.]|nr:hypothetical protein [Euzebya sp.]